MNEFDLLPALALLVAYAQLLLAISVFVERSSEVLFETLWVFGFSQFLPKDMLPEERDRYARFSKRGAVFLVAAGYSYGFNIAFPLFDLPTVANVALGALFMSFGAEFLHNVLAFLEKAKEYWRDAKQLR